MESIRKALKRNRKTSESHEKIRDRWGEEKEPVRSGVTFYLEYLGSTLVDELDEGLSYGNKLCAKAVRIILDMSKSFKNHPKVEMKVSSNGMTVTDVESHSVLTSLSIYRIHFCTADKTNDRVFAYIARSTENENMECHAFLCPKKKIAEAVTLTVAQAFQIAKEDYEAREQQQEKQRIQTAWNRNSEEKTHTGTKSALNHTLPSLGFEDSFTDFDVNLRTSGQGAKNNPFRNSTFNTDLNSDALRDNSKDWLEKDDKSLSRRQQNTDGDLIQL